MALFLPLIVFFYTFPCLAQPSPYQFAFLSQGGPAPNYVPANQTLIAPTNLARDAAGNVYFSQGVAIQMIGGNGLVVPVAGFLGGSSFAVRCCGDGDGGPALLATITVGGLGIDTSGNIWFTDLGPTLRRISPLGVLTTVAKLGTSSNAFSNGPLALDSDGNAYVITTGGIEKVTPSGQVTQYPHTASLNRQIFGIVVDSSGTVYVANYGKSLVQKVTPDGAIATIAGNGTQGYSGDGGPAVDAEVNPGSIVLDAAGNIYVSQYNLFTNVDLGMVRKISTDGMITTVAGGGKGFGEGGPATKAMLGNLLALAIDKAGNLYVAEANTAVSATLIRKIALDGTIHTIAGQLGRGCCGDGGPVSQAYFSGASGVARDAQGNLYLTDLLDHKVRNVAADLTVTTIAGSGLPGFAGDNGPAADAVLNAPQNLAVDNAGNLYVADTGNNRIRMVSPDGTIRTIAGDGVSLFRGDGGPAVKASLSGPKSVLADGSGNVFIADTGAHRIRKITPDGKIQTIAGNGTVGFKGDGGPATAAELSIPQSLAMDANGNLYIADPPVHTIRKINAAGVITTFAGTPGQYGFAGDGGPANQALLYLPRAVAVDGDGNVWIADTANGKIREVTSNGVITTASDSGYSVLGLAPDSNGNVYYTAGYLGYIYTGAFPFPPLPPEVPWGSIQNADGSQRGGAVAPGEMVSISTISFSTLFDQSLGPQQGVTATLDSSGKFADSLAGVQVLFNGIAAPMIYAQAQEIKAMVPFEVASAATVNIQVNNNGLKSNINTLPVAATFPGILGIVNQNGNLNNNEFAPQGSIISVYATGGGQTTPGGIDGLPVTGPLPLLLAPVEAFIQYPTGGSQTAVVSALVLYAGPAPTEVAGVMVANVQIPPLPGLQNSLSGPLTLLTLHVGGVAAYSAVNIQ